MYEKEPFYKHKNTYDINHGSDIFRTTQRYGLLKP